MRYRVYFWEERTTNGFLYVEADTHSDAVQKAREMYREDYESIIDNAGEFGSCGDEKNIYFDYAESDPEPSVSSDLWT